VIFRFLVRRLRFLARIQPLPLILDAMLLSHSWFFRPRVLEAIVMLEHEVREMEQFSLRTHRFGGTAFCIGRRELAHVHGNGLFDALLTRSTRDLAVQRGTAKPHHVFPNSTWVSFWIRDKQDVQPALELLRVAMQRLAPARGDGR
jgi:hypothetical protein